MGRRALRKIDPSLDLSRHLLAFDDLPQPWDAAALFGRNAPLEVEVGTGKGLFIAGAADVCPDHDFLGIELARKYARFAAAKIASRELPNARIANADALRIFHELLPSDTVCAVHVYFPDPWWKKRHHKRRVMTEAFVRDVQRVLAPAGQLHFWTDVKDYFVRTLEILADATTLRGPLAVPEAFVRDVQRVLAPAGQLHFWTDVKDYFVRTLEILADATTLRGPLAVPERPADHHMDYATHFERRVRLHGETVYRAAFQKPVVS